MLISLFFGGIAVSFSTCFGLDQALHIYTHIGLLVAVITVVCHTEGPCWITRLKTPRADCVESGNPLIARAFIFQWTNTIRETNT